MSKRTRKQQQDQYLPISELTVDGFKSIARKQSIDIRPLTVLAGANSSGKSSMLQPLLLLKQTLEATFDPGPLLLDGPNVRFTATDQIFSRSSTRARKSEFSIGVRLGPNAFSNTLVFADDPNDGVQIQRNEFSMGDKRVVLTPGMTQESIAGISFLKTLLKHFPDLRENWQVVRRRCFLVLGQQARDVGHVEPAIVSFGHYDAFPMFSVAEAVIHHIIHLGGLRGNPERTYRSTAVASNFPGRFEDYVASVIAVWQANRDEELETLSHDLAELGLTWKATANRIGDTQIELKVARLPKPTKGGSDDLVSIADVGFGVSQVLPVLVALLVAQSGQTVYIEQPEIHLHPRAQVALAGILAKAAQRGVRVVAETHSSLLLLGIQSLVAQGKLSPNDVILHWFQRSEKDGTTQVHTAELDDAGRYGDWPEDFGDVELHSESAYLNAVESHLLKK